MNKFQYDNGRKMAFHPGAYVEDIMEERELSLDELAESLGWNMQTLSDFVDGKIDVSRELALDLSEKLGISAEMWLKLQKKYDLICLKEKNRINISSPTLSMETGK